jgi:hypothetical protein
MDHPKFKPQVPQPLLENASQHERWVYERLDVAHQQNEWIIEQLNKGQRRFDDADDARELMRKEIVQMSSRLSKLEKFKDLISAKWAVVAAILSPIALVIVGTLVTHWIEKRIK